MASRELYDRRWQVTLADVDISELDVTFSVMKSTKREPNTAEVKVYNLAEATRSRIEQADPARVVIRAGYKDDGDPPPTLFVGDARRLFSLFEKPDIVTTAQARDKGRELGRARINKAYGPGTSVSRVLRDAVDALQIGRGNLSEFEIALTNGARNFADGYVSSGQASRVVNDLVRGAGLRWSVQNGTFQIMRRRQPLQTKAVRIAPDSGMIGSPTKSDKGIVSVTCLIQPGLDPGRRVYIDSRLIQGEMEIRKVEYTGDTRADSWSATIEAKAIR